MSILSADNLILNSATDLAKSIAAIGGGSGIGEERLAVDLDVGSLDRAANPQACQRLSGFSLRVDLHKITPV